MSILMGIIKGDDYMSDYLKKPGSVLTAFPSTNNVRAGPPAQAGKLAAWGPPAWATHTTTPLPCHPAPFPTPHPTPHAPAPKPRPPTPNPQPSRPRVPSCPPSAATPGSRCRTRPSHAASSITLWCPAKPGRSRSSSPRRLSSSRHCESGGGSRGVAGQHGRRLAPARAADVHPTVCSGFWQQLLRPLLRAGVTRALPCAAALAPPPAPSPAAAANRCP
jgi:hypothetical protein